MIAQYQTPSIGYELIAQAQTEDFSHIPYARWFMPLLPTPMFDEFCQAFPPEQAKGERRAAASSRVPIRPLARALSHEVKKLWEHWFEHRTN